MRVVIISLGEVDRETIELVAGAVRKTFSSETAIAGPIPVPPRTYNPRRKQYNATRILQALEVEIPYRDDLILGIIDQDLYVPELNFVFGQADIRARVAVVALARLRQEFYGFDPDRELFLARAVKEAVHEVGHARGLDHCPDPRCVMHFSNSLGETDVKKADFCAACRKKIVNYQDLRQHSRAGE